MGHWTLFVPLLGPNIVEAYSAPDAVEAGHRPDV